MQHHIEANNCIIILVHNSHLQHFLIISAAEYSMFLKLNNHLIFYRTNPNNRIDLKKYLQKPYHQNVHIYENSLILLISTQTYDTITTSK